VILETTEFAAEAGVARCATPADGGVDAADGGDSGAATTTVTFTTVRARTRTSSIEDGGVVDIPCPTPYEQTFPPEPRAVVIDAVLLGAGGAEVGRTTCNAETHPGASVAAKCDLLR
jgi:hypothetical protein